MCHDVGWVEVWSSVGMWRGLGPGAPWMPKSKAASVRDVRTVSPSYLQFLLSRYGGLADCVFTGKNI